jgi:hypothetical protein
MKIRHGFVSNSSSSSFIVAVSDIFEIPHLPKNLREPNVLKVPYMFGGNYEFGRERQNYTDIGSRINWAYLQAKSVEECKGKGHPSLKNKVKWINQHKNDVALLEKVLIDNIPGVDKIDWYLKTEIGMAELKNGIKNDREKYETSQRYFEGYVDHGSMWYEKQEEYEKIFEDENAIFCWIFGKGNYIANRSDEYEDVDELEVNHKYDYIYDLEEIFYNSWHDPEYYDENGNFIKDTNMIVANEADVPKLLEEGKYDYINYFTDTKTLPSAKILKNEWNVFYSETLDNRFIMKLKKLP